MFMACHKEIFRLAIPSHPKAVISVKFNRNDLQALGLIVNLGLSVAAPLLAGILLGRFLGERYGCQAFFVAAGALLGIVSGFLQAYRLLVKK